MTKDDLVSKDTALKMAIDTLQNAKRKHFYCEDTYYSCPKHEDGCADDRQPDECNCGADKLNAEIDMSTNACKEALEQPAQEPVAYVEYAWVIDADGLQSPEKRLLDYDNGKCEPLYPHPHQWQGLTDDEIDEIIKEKDGVFGAVVRAVEQALKDKNT
jgi:hypothetical protein